MKNLRKQNNLSIRGEATACFDICEDFGRNLTSYQFKLHDQVFNCPTALATEFGEAFSNEIEFMLHGDMPSSRTSVSG